MEIAKLKKVSNLVMDENWLFIFIHLDQVKIAIVAAWIAASLREWIHFW
jgi:hypothetical protein